MLPLYAIRALFNSSLASTSRWLVGSSSTRMLLSRLISLHRRTFACSPPERTLTLLSICLVVRPHLARAERTSYCVYPGNSCHISSRHVVSIATYLDVILNPLIGFITDSFYRTKLGRKFGRRRFFILTGIPLMLLYPMLWVKNMNFFYYLTTYILFEFVSGA